MGAPHGPPLDAPKREPVRAVRALPNTPSDDTESGTTTALVTRIVIVATIVVGQLFALTVALEVKLVDHDGQAWLLAAFSLVSFVVVLVLTQVDPPPRHAPRTPRQPRS